MRCLRAKQNKERGRGRGKDEANAKLAKAILFRVSPHFMAMIHTMFAKIEQLG